MPEVVTLTRHEPPSKIRVSIGSAIILGLAIGRMDADPTTIYLLTFHNGKCTANCGFCSQARTSTSRANLLSRVIWPTFTTETVVEKIKGAAWRHLISRVCIQAMNYPGVFQDVLGIVEAVHDTGVPISVSCQPLTKNQIKIISMAGVDRVCIPLDLPTKELFESVKGVQAGAPYNWERHIEALEEAVKILGKGNVSTHFIIGLGESDEEIIGMVQRMVDMGVYPSLFAFTPIAGTRMACRNQPPIQRYRRIQLAHYLITNGMSEAGKMEFNNEGDLLDLGVNIEAIRSAIKSGIPFMTSGCPGCNRPYYNERPGGTIYNYPRKPDMDELKRIEKQLMGG